MAQAYRKGMSSSILWLLALRNINSFTYLIIFVIGYFVAFFGIVLKFTVNV